MPRRIVLHAGFHKTGTSSVQATLRANRKTLMPACAIRLKGQMSELMSATRGYSTVGTPDALDKVRRRFDALLAGLPGMPRRTLLLSAEELSGHMPGRGDLTSYAAAPVLMYLFWERARDAFPATPFAMVFGLRDPADWQRSAWAEHVTSSSMTLSLAEFCDRYPHAPDLAGVVRDVTSRVPAPVHSFALEDAAARRLGPADAVLDHCDLPDALRATLTPQPVQNARLSDDTLAALLEANRTHRAPEARSAAKRAILEDAR
ncbi:hypothetical protein KDD17_12725 [Sulfitobacter albidus]|uniref:Uncharacterized protein n=1 Tax=Sulfitobacter albidus TaxID=2829501 RepID=A0A975JC79_9RHOB|nr:hypothetical protein [Sulfitobacter albidus]QUJ75802.1 hypothetical protein KDD17_12725 [Sulfitobacter albidus]